MESISPATGSVEKEHWRAALVLLVHLDSLDRELKVTAIVAMQKLVLGTLW
jgi:hypothetical protein